MPYGPTGDGPNSKTTRSNPGWWAARIATSCAWAFASPPLWAGQVTGAGAPVAPVGDGLGLGDGDADGVADGRATLGLGVGAAVAVAVGVGIGVTVGTQATTSVTARGAIRRNSRTRTFVV